jgi:hypothetical protein
MTRCVYENETSLHYHFASYKNEVFKPDTIPSDILQALQVVDSFANDLKSGNKLLQARQLAETNMKDLCGRLYALTNSCLPFHGRFPKDCRSVMQLIVEGQPKIDPANQLIFASFANKESILTAMEAKCKDSTDVIKKTANEQLQAEFKNLQVKMRKEYNLL